MTNRWRWELTRGLWSFHVDLSNLNRPYINADWIENDVFYLSIEYGNGNSDPAFSVCRTDIRAPRWVIRRADRKWQRIHVRRAMLRAQGRCDLCESTNLYTKPPDEEDEDPTERLCCRTCGHCCYHAEADATAR